MSNRFNELIVNNDDDFELVNDKSNNHIGIIKNVINSPGETKSNTRDTKKKTKNCDYRRFDCEGD